MSDVVVDVCTYVDFGGEATDKWTPYEAEFHDLTTISPEDMEVLDPGCLCLDATCIVADCGDGLLDPNIPPVYPPIENVNELHFDYNAYSRNDGFSWFKDQRRGSSMGPGYSGQLSGWQDHLNGERNSVLREKDGIMFSPGHSLGKALLDTNSVAYGSALPLDFVPNDFEGKPIVLNANKHVNMGALTVG